jgi:hypothetical protein
MPRVNKPSDVQKVKTHKLTKRRLMKILSAAGLCSASIKFVSTDDVKASDSDQVTISIDNSGERKKQVSADWYDQLVRARRVKNKMQNTWLDPNGNDKDKYDDVFGVWLDAGTGSNNPHVILTVDKNSDTKGETRGEIPEREEEVRIAVEEAAQDYEPACDDKCKNSTDAMPGGLEICINNGCGTLGPKMIDYDTNNYKLSTAAHVASTDNKCGSDLIGDPVYHCGDYYIGDVEYIDHDHDICVIDTKSSTEPLPEIWNPEDHSDRYGEIKNSLSAGGVDYWMENDRKLWKYGVSSCYSWGRVSARGKREKAGDYSPCAGAWEDCVRWGSINDLDAGDSGSVAFGADPDSNDFFACSQNSWRWWNYTAGPAAYAILDHHDYEWRQL